MMNFDVFISYPHQEKPTADAVRIASSLRADMIFGKDRKSGHATDITGMTEFDPEPTLTGLGQQPTGCEMVRIPAD
jgi:hypothetical protein